MEKTKFITCTLPYSNGLAHMGHAFEFILSDALSRYWKQKIGDENVIFNLGLDEHGKKIQDSAKSLGISEQEYLYKNYVDWKSFCQLFQIDYDIFYRTSDSDHHSKAQKFWKECFERGDIYKKKFSGRYCTGCEAFKVERELEENKCPDHPHLDIESVQEENYFFRLSKYKEHLEEWIEEADAKEHDFFNPNGKINELKRIVENIEDISISRLKNNVSWGVVVPDDPDHIIYIWLEALTNYIFTIGYYNNRKNFDKFWNHTIQIFGPDNLKFQAVIFQGLLASAGIKHTEEFLCHGTILDSQGKKMSKSLGNVVDPIEQVEKYGINAVRYYALAGISLCGNSAWDEKALVELYNSHLADNFGNLLNRVLHLLKKKGITPNPGDPDDFEENFYEELGQVDLFYEHNDPNSACAVITKLLTYGNGYIQRHEPWSKECKDPERILSNLYWLLEKVAWRYVPIIPDKARQALIALRTGDPVVLFPKLEYKE